MSIKEKIKNGLVFFDGGTGTMLQSLGLMLGELPETWNITHPNEIINLHKEYLEAGANIIKTNTFGANSFKFDGKEGKYSLESIVSAGVCNARNALEQCENMNTDHYIALDVGPTGKMLRPLGDLEFEHAVEIFGEIIRCGVSCGVDLILIETMGDSYEMKAAVLAAKENCDLPVFVTAAYNEDGKLLTGADPEAVVALLEGLRVDALGINCSLGPEQMKNIISQLLKYASIPVIVNPNAGLPHIDNGKVAYDITPESFAKSMSDIVKMGARIVGGCCGTTPAFTKQMIHEVKNIVPVPLSEKNHTIVSSYTHGVEIGKIPVLIGERINPTGKSKFKEALREHNIDYILNEGISQREKGVHILDVNVGLPEINEPEIMAEAVSELQSILDLPLQIDTSDIVAMEKAMRIYNGKPMVNSVNGKLESMNKVFPLVAKYGGVVVALTLDEDGIPETAIGRAQIADKIYKTAEKYGIEAKNIIIDTLAMAVSADSTSAQTTLEAIKLIKSKKSRRTVLGVSNISFGLPNRDFITSTFFSLALNSGLDAAIMNPYSADMMKTYYSYLALAGLVNNFVKYIDFASNASVQVISQKTSKLLATENDEFSLRSAIINGLREKTEILTKHMLGELTAMEIINNHIIPALDTVGKGFEGKAIFLPQLLMSAEAARVAFDVVKGSLTYKEKSGAGNKIILATVKGDIHDIGKNIVKVLLQNYGFDIIDLGRDVPVDMIVSTCVSGKVKLVGLSALMTTTVASIEETIKELRKCAPWCKVMVGGAVLTKEYARMIDADNYGKDAMESVRYAETIFAE